MKIEQRAVSDAPARSRSGVDPVGDTQWEAAQSQNLESILGYGSIIESAQQQYELKAIRVLFPPSPGCQSCSLPVLAQSFVGPCWALGFIRAESQERVFCSDSQSGITKHCARVTEQVVSRKQGEKLLMPHALPNVKPLGAVLSFRVKTLQMLGIV